MTGQQKCQINTILYDSYSHRYCQIHSSYFPHHTNTYTIPQICFLHTQVHTYKVILKMSQSHVSSFNADCDCSLAFQEPFLVLKTSGMLFVSGDFFLGCTLHKNNQSVQFKWSLTVKLLNHKSCCLSIID